MQVNSPMLLRGTMGIIKISTTRGKIGHLAEDTAVWRYIDPRVLWILTKRYILSNQDNYDFVNHVVIFTNCYGGHDLYRTKCLMA